MENKNQTRIAICGTARAGKDHFADNLATKLREEGKTVVKIAFADEIKGLYREFFGKVSNSCKPRDAYIKIGNTFREIHPNVWVEALERRLEYLYTWDVVIITDLRFPNELDYCMENGFKIVKIVADDNVRIQRSNELGEELDLNNDGDIHVKELPSHFEVDTSNNPDFSKVFRDLKLNGMEL